MNYTSKKDKSTTLTIVGVIAMIILTITKIVPSSQIAGYGIFVGIAFFFIVERVEKKSGAESGLRFNTILADIKKPGVLFWMLLPMVSAVATLFVGNLIFSEEFVSHVLGRTSSMLSFDKIPLLIIQIIIAAWGEEIAFRGFFLGKSMRIFPFWICAVVSSVVFAAGHIAAGNIGLVAYDIATIFVDSMIFAIIYRRSQNCMISTFSHILGNAIALTAALVLYR